MSFSQHVEDCEIHPECDVIRYLDGDRQLWESHAHNSTHVPCRLNDAAPHCDDKRSGKTHRRKATCKSCQEHFSS